MARRAWLVALAILAILAVAAIARLHALDLRPPHHDEGVNGWFVEHMHTEGYYRYDPTNYHGPTYFYLLWAARELLGFGLWQYPLASILLELVIVIAGAYLYWRAAERTGRAEGVGARRR